MRAYFENLSKRERYMVVAAALVLLVFLFYVLVWRPIGTRAEALQQRVQGQEKALAWMQQAAVEVKRLRGGGTPTQARNESLLSLIERTARERGLSGAVRRVQPEGQHGARIWLEAAGFDDLVLWLHQLADTYGVRISEASVERQPQPGLVNARLLVEGAA